MSQNLNKKVIKNFFDETPITKSHLIMIVILAMAFIFEQCDNFNFTYVAPSLREYWGLSVQQIGYINTIFSIGMLIGSFIFGMVSDRFGRRKALIIAACVFSTFSLLNGLAPNPAVFTLMRFLTGVGLCGVIVVAPTYIVEILPAKNRGRLFGITLGCGYLGIPLIAVLCNIIIPMGTDHWRYVYILGCAGYVVALLSLKFLQESPRWLVSKGRVQEAEAIVEGIIGPEYKCDFSEVKVFTQKLPTLEILKIIFSKRHIKETLALLSCNALVLPAGLIFVNNSATLLVARGFSMEQAMHIATLLSIGMLCGPVIAAVVGDRGGRKWPIAICNIGLMVFCLSYGFADNYLLMCITGVLAAAFVQGVTVMSSNYGPELYPTKYRNAATGMVGTLGRIGAILMMTAYPVVYTMWDYLGVYIFLTIAVTVSALAVIFLGKRTGGVVLESVSED